MVNPGSSLLIRRVDKMKILGLIALCFSGKLTAK